MKVAQVWVSFNEMFFDIDATSFARYLGASRETYAGYVSIKMPNFSYTHNGHCVASVTSSPLFSIYGETISGLTVIRAFGMPTKFLKDMIICADTVRMSGMIRGGG